MVSASDDGIIKIWDAASGQEFATLDGHTDRIWSVEFSPDGSRVVSASADGTSKVWDAETGRELATLEYDFPEVRRIGFAAMGRTVFTVTPAGRTRVWRSLPWAIDASTDWPAHFRELQAQKYREWRGNAAD